MWKKSQWITSHSYTAFSEVFKTLESYFLQTFTFPGIWCISWFLWWWIKEWIFQTFFFSFLFSFFLSFFFFFFFVFRYEKSCLVLSKELVVVSWQENRFSDSTTFHHPLNHPLPCGSKGKQLFIEGGNNLSLALEAEHSSE